MCPWEALCLTKEWYANAPVFLHELTSPCGHRRLVAVSICPRSESFETCIMKVAFFRDPKIVCRTAGHDALYSVFDRADNSSLRLFAGQVDLNDKSHFTLKYECSSGSGVIDGWLRDEDYVVFRTLSGPWKMPLNWFERSEKACRE